MQHYTVWNLDIFHLAAPNRWPPILSDSDQVLDPEQAYRAPCVPIWELGCDGQEQVSCKLLQILFTQGYASCLSAALVSLLHPGAKGLEGGEERAASENSRYMLRCL